MSEQYVDLLAGYQPARLAAARSIAESLAQPVDVLRVGPGMSMSAIKEIAMFTAIRPLDKQSTARVVIIDMDGARRSIQTSLLRTLEEPADYIKYIITVAEESDVLETIRSRCNIARCRPGAYGAVVRDLNQSGLSLASAARSAKGILSGYDLATLPDDQSLMRAKSFIEEVQSNAMINALRLALDFEQRDLEALRQQLLTIGAVSLVEATYDSTDAPNAAMRVVIAALRKQ